MARSKKQEEHAGYGELPGHLSGDVHVHVGRRHGMTLSGAQAVAEVTGGRRIGDRLNAGKLPWHLLPYDAVREIVKVLQFGAQKYAERNWEKGLGLSSTFDSTMRHLTAWYQDREELDAESRIRTMAHVGCNVLFLLAFELRGRTDLDDRPSKTVTP